MNRTDRLLAIILELQGKGWQRAEDLAETFETSKRTIYRDIQALGEAGVPLVSIPGLGYSLMIGLNFVMLYVPDIEQARAFYTEKLGFVVEAQQPTFVQFKQNAGMGALFALQ